jgi:hypothetical protein
VASLGAHVRPYFGMAHTVASCLSSVAAATGNGGLQQLLPAASSSPLLLQLEVGLLHLVAALASHAECEEAGSAQQAAEVAFLGPFLPTVAARVSFWAGIVSQLQAGAGAGAGAGQQQQQQQLLSHSAECLHTAVGLLQALFDAQSAAALTSRGGGASPASPLSGFGSESVGLLCAVAGSPSVASNTRALAVALAGSLTGAAAAAAEVGDYVKPSMFTLDAPETAQIVERLCCLVRRRCTLWFR